MKNNPDPSDEREREIAITAFEDQLRRLELPRSTMNRDQLMYDAGWAAAMASLPVAASPGVLAVEDIGGLEDDVKVSFDRSNDVFHFWQALSGVASVAALVFAGLFFLNDPQVVVENGRTESIAQVPAADIADDDSENSVVKESDLKLVVESPRRSAGPRGSSFSIEQMMRRWPDNVSLSVGVLRGDLGMARNLAMAESTEAERHQASKPKSPLRSGSWQFLEELGIPSR